MISVTIQSNFKPLTKLRGNLKKEIGVKVGVLGSGEARTGGPLGNAEIGLIQEFGSVTKKIPPRSWLVMPLTTHAKDIEAAFNKSSINKKVMGGDIVGAMKLVGIVAENIIHDAFKTGGFGKWAPNAPSTVKSKGSSAPLIDTRQLDRSVTSEVVGGS